MLSFLSSPSFLTPPLKRPHFALHSQQQSPETPPPPPQQGPSPSPSHPPQQLSSAAATSSPQPVEETRARKAGAPSTSSADSTDWIASGLSRRFGVGAGLAWAAFLAVGVLSEQAKTRFEAYQQEAGTRDVEKEKEVLLPNGIKYYEIRVGGGASPRQGDLVVIDLQGKLQGSKEVFMDTFSEGKRPLALVMGSRPYTKGMCEGVEHVLKLMKAGGKARFIIPPSLGFGDNGADLGSGVMIPPSSTLEYVLQIDKVTIAPA